MGVIHSAASTNPITSTTDYHTIKSTAIVKPTVIVSTGQPTPTVTVSTGQPTPTVTVSTGQPTSEHPDFPTGPVIGMCT